MSLYDVDSLSSVPSLSTAILNVVINSQIYLSGLIAILPPSLSNIIYSSILFIIGIR
jgi:hypothetical protein